MPILAAETNLYPEGLLEAPESVSEDRTWWALHTKPRQEKQLMRLLLRREIPFYTPIAAQSYRSPSGRKRTSYLPLFSNYVFLCSDSEGRMEALNTNCVVTALEIPNREEIEHELLSLERLIQLGQQISLESKIGVGVRVRVKSGAMKGVVGRVVKRHGVERLIVAVDFLNQGASVELNDWDVEIYD